MTIDELISELEDARAELSGSAEVRIAYQQAYPLRGTIARVTVPEPEPYGDDESAPGQEDDGSMLWLAAGSVSGRENPYGPAWAWNSRIA